MDDYKPGEKTDRKERKHHPLGNIGVTATELLDSHFRALI
jgi:hypothetical protein